MKHKKLLFSFILAIFGMLGFIACNSSEKGGKNNPNPIAPVAVGDKWGYIDKSGKFIINPQFVDIKEFD
ncbi:MAG: WG repeat-containing protein [Bacteroidales bacterium]|nr:WG repeat-containing protein [Bacteroidales bacterium]